MSRFKRRKAAGSRSDAICFDERLTRLSPTRPRNEHPIRFFPMAFPVSSTLEFPSRASTAASFACLFPAVRLPRTPRTNSTVRVFVHGFFPFFCYPRLPDIFSLAPFVPSVPPYSVFLVSLCNVFAPGSVYTLLSRSVALVFRFPVNIPAFP